MVLNVAVLGAGINGLASAVKIKKKYPDYRVVVISSEFSPNTTSDGAGGFWYPYLTGSTREDQLTKWGLETYKLLHQLWLEGSNDVCLQPCFHLYRNKEGWRVPGWANLVYGYRIIDGEYLKYLNGLYSTEYAAGHTFLSFVYTPSTILTKLLNQFKSLNGEVLQGKVASLEDNILAQFDVVINCLGISAQTVVPDERVHAIRGQITKVEAPWVNETILDAESGNYILPNVRFCVLGGTNQKNDNNKTVDNNDTEHVMNGCYRINPSLKHAKIITQWVGLRPGRDEVRLEAVHRNGKLFIHNYGHGGSGLTLFWGCATEVLDLLDKNKNNNILSKM